MKRFVIMCDNPLGCKKETEDVFSEGWITIEGGNGVAITVGMGRRSDGSAKPAGHYSGVTVHFCSVKCVSAFLLNLCAEAEKKGESQCGQSGGCSAQVPSGNVLMGDPRQWTPNQYLGSVVQAPTQQPGTTTTTITTPTKKYPLTEPECIRRGGHCFEVQGSVPDIESAPVYPDLQALREEGDWHRAGWYQVEGTYHSPS